VTEAQHRGQGGAAFRHRGFTLYWSAQLISLMGTFMQQVALGYLVYDLTGSKWLLGVISAVTMGPSLLLALPAGVLADRIQRRRLIVGTQSTALLLAFALATLTATHALQVWEIIAISTISGIAIAVESPARQAFIIDLVGRQDLSNAIAWNSLVVSGARVLGPAVGGIAIRYVGVAPIFYYNSFSFLAMIVVLLSLHLAPALARTARNPVAELREGLAYVARSPAVITILALLAVVATFALNFNVLMPIFARDQLHGGAEVLGWMWTAMGLGAVLGSATVVRWSSAATRGPLLLVSACSAGLAELIMSRTDALPFTLAALVAVGWGTGSFFAGANASVQARVTDELRGRVLSLYTMIFSGTGPIGGLITAGLASTGGVSFALLVSGAICVLAVLLALPFFTSRVAGSPTPVPAGVPAEP
jgi:MFS family permease